MNNEAIKKIFADNFGDIDFSKKQSIKRFKCPNQEACKVVAAKEPIWSPALGTEGSKIMIVAEAPSASGGLGPHSGGLIKDWNEKSVKALIAFVEKHYGTLPHFTDLMKCGVAKQTNENKKAVFRIRTEKCLEHYLLKEIAILDPEIILCVGKESYTALLECQRSVPKRIKDSIKLVPLIHYGKQAGIPLTFEDKQNVIWPIQVGQIPKEEIKEKMSELSIFKKWCSGSEDREIHQEYDNGTAS